MSIYSGTQTEKNLMTALNGESRARSLYTFFASQAKKEGYEQIASLFQQTAENEKEHAKLWARELRLIGSTEENLQLAAENERSEWTEMYKRFADDAEREGFRTLAEKFKKIAYIESEHEKRYGKLFDRLTKSEIFIRDGIQVWVCRNCGYLFVGREAPETCPACDHPQAYFEIRSENY